MFKFLLATQHLEVLLSLWRGLPDERHAVDQEVRAKEISPTAG
jgi:hypothetical protein